MKWSIRNSLGIYIRYDKIKTDTEQIEAQKPIYLLCKFS